MKKIFYFLCAMFMASSIAQAADIRWQEWSDHVFEQAKKENKFVLLNMEAVWCHWCHVMDQTTYRDGEVIQLIEEKYIPVRADQDAHPDLSLRYEQWGWPATVVLNADGSEIVKRRGYMEPQVMVTLLKAIIGDPTPGPSVLPEVEIKGAENAFLTPEEQGKLYSSHQSLYDQENGGWGDYHKLILPFEMEYALVKAQIGDFSEEKMARKTLDQALNLLDSQWGGFFQYSDKKDWKSPHYEKIMSVQASYIRHYVMAYSLWKENSYLEAAQKTADFVLKNWTNSEGAFYTSQDADVDEKMTGHDFYVLSNEERLKLERVPRIDKHVYTRENAWMVRALLSIYDVTGEKKYLDHALKGAQWILRYRGLAGGGFRHDETDKRGPYLGDNLAAVEAFLALYVSTTDRVWLLQAERTLRFIQRHFADSHDAGFWTSPVSNKKRGVFKNSIKQLEENITVARAANLLFYFTGKKEYKKISQNAMRYLVSIARQPNQYFLSGILLSDLECSSEPTHVTIVGSKNDSQAFELYRAALAQPLFYKRLEWWDPKEGYLPYRDVEFPLLNQAAAFVCVRQACSLPSFTSAELIKSVKRSE
jgi:uncharacterized protein YyaL (SSP411 family)